MNECIHKEEIYSFGDNTPYWDPSARHSTPKIDNTPLSVKIEIEAITKNQNPKRIIKTEFAYGAVWVYFEDFPFPFATYY